MRTFLISLLLSASLAGAAVADDGVAVSGTACTPATKTDKTYFRYYAAGARLWYGDESRTLFCPLRLRGDSLAGTSRDLTWARVTVEDRHGSAGFSCSLRARSLAGGTYYSSARTTGSSYKGTAVLSWWTYVINGGAPVPSMANAVAVCEVPAPQSYDRSAVMGVSVGY